MPRVFAHFFVCTNQRPDSDPLPSCGPCGGLAVFQAFSRELAQHGYPRGVKVTGTGCLTPCRQGPNVVVYPEGVWYAGVTAGDVREILEAHLEGTDTVTRLELPAEVRVS